MAAFYNNFYVKVRVKGKLLTTPKLDGESKAFSSFSSIPADVTNVFNFIDGEIGDIPNPEPGPTPEPEPVKGKVSLVQFWLGIRLNRLLYDDKTFRNKVGLYLKDDLSQEDLKASVKALRSANDGISLGFFSTVYATFVSQETDKVYVPWGKKHRTYIYFDRNLSNDEISQFLYGYTFKIGPEGSSYKIEADSIRARSSKKSAVIF